MIEANRAHDIGLINEIVPRARLYARADEVVKQLAGGPTLVHADHKKLLRAWSSDGMAAADALMPAMAGKSLVTGDEKGSLKNAIDALKAGKPRPKYPFKGR